MTLKPCVECGEVTDATRCPDHQTEREQRTSERKGSATARGYDTRWARLSARARRLQPFCSDCGTSEDLTADHLVWPATKLEHVDVVCRPCNSRRGARRGDLTTRGSNPPETVKGPPGKAKFESHTALLMQRDLPQRVERCLPGLLPEHQEQHLVQKHHVTESPDEVILRRAGAKHRRQDVAVEVAVTVSAVERGREADSVLYPAPKVVICHPESLP